jgi:hypothetical protein
MQNTQNTKQAQNAITQATQHIVNLKQALSSTTALTQTA